MIRNRKFGALVLWLVCGVIIGSLFGELLGLLVLELVPM